MRTGYAWRPVSLYNTVHTDSFTAIIIIIIMIIIKDISNDNLCLDGMVDKTFVIYL